MSRFRRAWLAALLCAGGLAGASWAFAFDDDKPRPEVDGAKPPAEQAEDGEKPDADPLAEWKKLTVRKREIARKLKELRKEFDGPDATDKRKREIRDEFTRLVSEYRFQVEPRMGELAPAAYAADPQDVEAAEAVMETAYNNNRYERALAIAKNLLESEQKTKYAGNLAINIAGAANFALNQFEQAQQYLQQAEEQKQLDEQRRRLLEQVPTCIEFWKREQKLRAEQAAAEGDEQLPMVELTIGRGEKELGKVVIELFENEAPNTVANFISIVEGEEKNYNGVKFHRVLNNFMAQTGDLKTAGKPPLGYTIPCECYQEDARKHFRGSVAMALKGKDTGDSQFYITHMPTFWLNEEVRPDSVHTVFGRVVKGMDVIDQVKQDDEIVSAKVLFKRDHEYKPKTVPAAEAGE